MRFGFFSVLVSASFLLTGVASPAGAAGVPVSIDLTALRCIQKYSMDEKGEDQVYLLVDGVAAGKELHNRFPEGNKTLEAGPKKMPINAKNGPTLWKGDLDNGQFALVSVSIFQGDDKDQKLVQGYETKLNAALKGVAERSAATTDAAGAKKLATSVVKAEQGVISKIKETFSREKKTDHYSGLFNVLVWNNGGKIMKRVDPVGLTFGEHYGNDMKIYTKLKNTRNNVFVQDEKTKEWATEQLMPTSDDNKTVRIKMLETELIKTSGNPIRKTTDYLAEIQVKQAGKPLEWNVRDEVTGVDDIHTYWGYAD